MKEPSEAAEVREAAIQQTFDLDDFVFQDGSSVESLRVCCTLLGNPQGAPVLVLHGTGGSGRGLLNEEFGGELFKPGGTFDAAHHLLILPDAIGHGGSAKPSDGLRARFAQFNYVDMVDAQFRVVSECLGIHHLRAIVGVSMGGMHAWNWATRYPDFMDAVVPMAALPTAMSGRNWLLRRLLVDAIRADPQWDHGNYVVQPPSARRALEFFSVATNGGTQRLQMIASSSSQGDLWLEEKRAEPFQLDANDMLYQWEASRDYDPWPAIHNIRAHVLAILSTDDERNPLSIMQNAMKDIPNARLLLIPGTENTRGHGTVGLAATWAEDCREFLTKVPAQADQADQAGRAALT